MNEIWLKKWNTICQVRSNHPPFRQMLLWIRDVGFALIFVLCMGIALLASPAVLSDHSWLQSYVNFMGGYFGAVQRLSVGAIYPQVSQLVFAVGVGVALVPFAAWLMYTVIYILLIDYKKTKTDMEIKYEIKTKVGGHFLEKINTPAFAIILGIFYLGDFGVINNFGWVNGLLITHAKVIMHHHDLMNDFVSPIYTSRWGLGIGSPVLIYVGVALYSVLWTIPFFYLPIWLRRRFTRQSDEVAK